MELELKLGFKAKSQLFAGVWLHCPSTLRFFRLAKVCNLFSPSDLEKGKAVSL